MAARGSLLVALLVALVLTLASCVQHADSWDACLLDEGADLPGTILMQRSLGTTRRYFEQEQGLRRELSHESAAAWLVSGRSLSAATALRRPPVLIACAMIVIAVLAILSVWLYSGPYWLPKCCTRREPNFLVTQEGPEASASRLRRAEGRAAELDGELATLQSRLNQATTASRALDARSAQLLAEKQAIEAELRAAREAARAARDEAQSAAAQEIAQRSAEMLAEKAATEAELRAAQEGARTTEAELRAAREDARRALDDAQSAAAQEIAAHAQRADDHIAALEQDRASLQAQLDEQAALASRAGAQSAERLAEKEAMEAELIAAREAVLKAQLEAEEARAGMDRGIAAHARKAKAHKDRADNLEQDRASLKARLDEQGQKFRPPDSRDGCCGGGGYLDLLERDEGDMEGPFDEWGASPLTLAKRMAGFELEGPWSPSLEGVTGTYRLNSEGYCGGHRYCIRAFTIEAEDIVPAEETGASSLALCCVPHLLGEGRVVAHVHAKRDKAVYADSFMAWLIQTVSGSIVYILTLSENGIVRFHLPPDMGCFAKLCFAWADSESLCGFLRKAWAGSESLGVFYRERKAPAINQAPPRVVLMRFNRWKTGLVPYWAGVCGAKDSIWAY